MASWHVSGQGPAVVCVHGAGVSSRQTLPLLEVFDGTREAWAVDLPGFGASTATEEDVSAPWLADALLSWLHAKGLTESCLLGVSLGTQVVAEAAARAPEDVGSVVLVGPTVDPQARSLPVQAGRLIYNNFFEGFSVVFSSLADYRDAGSRRVVHSWLESRNHRIERVLPKVKAPTLVLRGGKDVVCPQPWAEEATRLLPHGRLVIVPGGPHALSSAAPGEVSRHVDDFLRKVEQ